MAEDNTNFLLAKTTNGSEVLFDSILGAYYIKLTLGKYIRPEPFGENKWTPEKGIILPLPTDLQDSTSAEYSNQNLKAVGDVINGDFVGLAGRGMLGAAGKTGSFLGSLIKVGKNDSVAQKAAKTGASSAANAFDSESISTAIEQSLGVAVNPNPTVAFEGPSLRTFKHSWLLQPRNSQESEKIKNIVALLKSRTLPKNAIKDAASILEYPYLCQVNYFPWDSGGGNNDWGWSSNSIIRYKKAFISDVDVNYTPSNVPAFFNGTWQPVAMSLTLTFREIEYMLADDWDPSIAQTATFTDRVKQIGNKIGVELGDGASYINEWVQSLADDPTQAQQ